MALFRFFMFFSWLELGSSVDLPDRIVLSELPLHSRICICARRPLFSTLKRPGEPCNGFYTNKCTGGRCLEGVTWGHVRAFSSGWERQGRDSDFRALSQSFVRILDSTDEDRDDSVSSEIDRLREQKVPTRGAFLSEMLCLQFPELYPVLNQPVQDYLKAVKFMGPRGASEGARYIDLAKKLRSSLLQPPPWVLS
jgi:hypothetical protein